MTSTASAFLGLFLVAAPLLAATEAEQRQQDLDELRNRIKAVQEELRGDVSRKDDCESGKTQILHC